MNRRGAGEGSVYQQPDGLWCAVLSLGRDPKTGKRVRRKIRRKAKTEVVTELARAIATARLKQKRGYPLYRDTLPDWLTRGAYVAADEDAGFLKVGMTTTDVRKRVADVAQGTPFNLELIAFAPTEAERLLETRLIAALAPWHVKGEWFRYTPADVDAISSAIRGVLGGLRFFTAEEIAAAVKAPKTLTDLRADLHDEARQ